MGRHRASRFSVKLAKELTHIKNFDVVPDDLKIVLEGPLLIGEKLGVLLIQLAPKRSLDLKISASFFSKLCSLYFGPIALEPRHPSWVSSSANFLYSDCGISLVTAGPKVLPNEIHKSTGGFGYARLHGSPMIYKNRYSLEKLKEYTGTFLTAPREQWCIFDNTTFGYAT